MLTLGSLFDGIGGFPLAAVNNGIVPLWASEIEPFPIAGNQSPRFPQICSTVGDITKLDGAELPPVDVIAVEAARVRICQLPRSRSRFGRGSAPLACSPDQVRISRGDESMQDDTTRAYQTTVCSTPDTSFMGKRALEPSPQVSRKRRGLPGRSSRRLSISCVPVPVMCLDLTPGAGNLLGGCDCGRYALRWAWRVLDAQHWGVARSAEPQNLPCRRFWRTHRTQDII